MQELTMNEIDAVSGADAVHAGMFYTGLLAGIAGAVLTVAGLGTPISIGGAALAVEGGALVSLSFGN